LLLFAEDENRIKSMIKIIEKSILLYLKSTIFINSSIFKIWKNHLHVNNAGVACGQFAI